MKNRFTIGQMSKFHNIPIKTLRYYDEIDLFNPAEVDHENGYRYYSTEQFKQLDIINYLKALGVPLKEIKEQLNNRDINDFLQTLYKHKKITEHKIKELEQIKKRLNVRIKEIEGTKKIDNIGQPSVQVVPERTVVQLEGQIKSVDELELSLRKLKNEFQQLAPIFLGKVGLTLSTSNVEKGICHEYNSIFLLLEDREDRDTFHDMITHFPKGNYAYIYFRGMRSDAKAYYNILLDYIHENNFEIIGDFIERAIVDQFISSDEASFLTEIQVPIKKTRRLPSL